MALTIQKRQLTFTFEDVRGDRRRVSIGVTAADAGAGIPSFLTGFSKCAVKKSVELNTYVDLADTPAADSEVRDTLRLYFRMPKGDIGTFDIPDPDDSIFLSSTGPGANVLKDYATLAASPVLSPSWYCSLWIDGMLGGLLTIEGGELPAAYLRGERLV